MTATSFASATTSCCSSSSSRVRPVATQSCFLGYISISRNRRNRRNRRNQRNQRNQRNLYTAATNPRLTVAWVFPT